MAWHRLRLFLLSLGLCNPLFVSFLKNYACSRFPCFSKSHSGVCGHLIVNCCFTYYILLLVLGIISTVGNLRPFASDLIEEWTIGTLLLYKLRVPLLLLIWVVAGGDCWSVCLLLTEPVIALLDSAAECCLFLSYKTLRLILCSLFWRLFFLLFWRLFFLLASPALCFRSHCRVGYWNFTFVQTARAFAVLDLTAGLVVLWLVAGGDVDPYACFFDQRTILSLPFMRCPLFLTLVCQLYLVLVDSAAECSGVALTVSAITLLGSRGRWCFLDSVADCCFVWFFTKTTPALSALVSKKNLIVGVHCPLLLEFLNAGGLSLLCLLLLHLLYLALVDSAADLLWRGTDCARSRSPWFCNQWCSAEAIPVSRSPWDCLYIPSV